MLTLFPTMFQLFLVQYLLPSSLARYKIAMHIIFHVGLNNFPSRTHHNICRNLMADMKWMSSELTGFFFLLPLLSQLSRKKNPGKLIMLEAFCKSQEMVWFFSYYWIYFWLKDHVFVMTNNYRKYFTLSIVSCHAQIFTQLHSC